MNLNEVQARRSNYAVEQRSGMSVLGGHFTKFRGIKLGSFVPETKGIMRDNRKPSDGAKSDLQRASAKCAHTELYLK
jgi:hypothetical protein